MDLFRTFRARRSALGNRRRKFRLVYSAELLERRDLLATDGLATDGLATDGLATDGQIVGRLVTDRPAVDQLAISEVHFDPTGGNSEQDEYFEVRGVPGAIIPSGTYFVVVEAARSDPPIPARSILCSISGA